MFISKALVTFTILLSQQFASYVDAAAVISIDFGSEWMKIGIVSPGVPMEIVLNKESKRKTPAVIAFKDGVRTFGEDAASIGVKSPKNAYKHLLELLGKPYDHPLVQTYMKRFPYYEIISSDRGSPVFVHDSNTTFTPEELVAQLLAEGKKYAETNHNHAIKDCVITVPGYFNRAERNAMKTAASLAGLNVLQLINDYTAIAINFGLYRRKDISENASYYLFFDMGAVSAKAALVEYKLVKTKEKGYVETVPQLQVISVGYDRTLGGLEMTLRLRDHLIKAWKAQGGGDVTGSPRAMEKLLREAERVKVVLSANADHYAQIENLLDDKDFKLKVTREEFEALCSDLWPRLASVVARAVAGAQGAGVGAQLVIAGSGARAPAALAAIRDAMGHDPSRSINADEAAALGASYRAATLATGFKVAPLIVRDAVLFPIQVVFSRQVDGEEKLIKRMLFGPWSPYPQKKVITFNKNAEDFTFSINHAELDHLPHHEIINIGSLNLSTVSLKGVSEAINKHTGDNVELKGIKAHFHMDDSGILNFVHTELVVEKNVTETDDSKDPSTLSKLSNTISKLFSSDTDVPENSEEKKDDVQPNTVKNETSQTNETVAQKLNATETEGKPKSKIVVVKEKIMASEEILHLPSFDDKQLKESKNKIKKLNNIDRLKAEREHALNSLESLVLELKRNFDTEEYAECGTSEQIESLLKLCNEVSVWLDDDGYNADTEQFKQKQKMLEELSTPILYKHHEHKYRPEAINAIRQTLNKSEQFLKMAKNLTKDYNNTEELFTNKEIETLEKLIIETDSWLNKSIVEQNALKKNEEVVLTLDMIREKISLLDRETKYLLNKMSFWRPKTLPKKPEVNKTEEVVIDKQEEQSSESNTDNKIETNLETESDTETTETPQKSDDEHTEL